MKIISLFKNTYKTFRSKKYKNVISWKKDSRLHVGAECNKYFTEKKWKQNFQKIFPKADHYYQIKFFENRYEKFALVPSLNIICATWADQNLIDSAKNLKWIHIMQAGTECLEGISKTNDLKITNVQGIASEGIAEYVLGVSLALLKNICYAFNNQMKKAWKQDYFLTQEIYLLKQKKIGVLGMGNNGKAVAKIFKALGCYVAGFDKEDIRLDCIDHLYYNDQLDNIIEDSEILAICLPFTPDTKNLITLRELQLLGKEGILINVARGQIVNESDLIYALRKHIIFGAALDVFNKEPLSRLSPLWRCPNVIITPHIAGNINNFVDRIQNSFIEQLKRYKPQ